ncbi:MAG: hypothetical protein ACYDER_08035 [Ktedonobacteraceae bacterium]
MVKQMGKSPIPYVIIGTGREQNLRFYTGYDEHFLFNKVATFMYILDEGEPAIQHIEECLIANGGAKLSERYLEAIRAEIFFTALHQCETFFALLIAPFQSLPHWLFLTTYETKAIKQAVELILANNISALTNSVIPTIADFIKVAVYTEVTPADPQLASRWDENIDNAAWLVTRIGKFFFKYDRAYNSYKHGLRVMTGPHQIRIGQQNPDGATTGPMHILQDSEDSVMYLQKELVREVDSEKEIPISEVTKAFNPFEAFFYLAKMNQMLETIKATRLALLKGGPVESMNTFFGLDRDEVERAERFEEWKQEPARADQARAYTQLVAQMQQTQAAPPINTASEEQENDDQS